jgi:RNA polymerase sigma-70 factor (ECF subfamily)
MRRDSTIEQVRVISRPWWRRKASAVAWTLTELQERYTDAVYGYVALRLGVGAEAEDATAETFVAAFTRLHACPTREKITENDDPMRAYLIGIARRKVADILRLHERRQETPLSETLTSDATQEHGVLAAEASARLTEILAALRPDYREVLLLKYVEGHSLAEIGHVLKRSPTQVGSLLQQAREAARREGNDYFGH